MTQGCRCLPRAQRPASSRNRVSFRVRVANHGRHRAQPRQRRRAHPVPKRLCKPLHAPQQPAKQKTEKQQRRQVRHQPRGRPPLSKQPPGPKRRRRALRRRQAHQTHQHPHGKESDHSTQRLHLHLLQLRQRSRPHLPNPMSLHPGSTSHRLGATTSNRLGQPNQIFPTSGKISSQVPVRWLPT